MIATALCALLALSPPAPPAGDSLDAFIRALLAARKVPGLSIAVVDGGRIVLARGYGVATPGGSTPVTPATRFLAGSVSKSIAALGALRLVEEGALSLDGDVNDQLTTWKVPDNAFTAAERVTVRRILSHTAGLTVHGFGGYAVDQPVPTVPQILDGVPPANSAAVRVDTTPGSVWRYSGGGYTVLQLLMHDVTGVPFDAWMTEHVLAPLGMSASTFRQPPPPALVPVTAAGQYAPGKPVPGRWHLYPEMAAAGLWSTPSDLARFVIGMQESFAGRSTPVISQAMTQLMLTDVRNGDGLGVFVDTTAGHLSFSHGGRDDGFDTFMKGYAASGRGIVIMINANDNSSMMRSIHDFVARRYGWPVDVPAYATSPRANVPPARVASWGGRYEISNNQMLTLAPQDGRLVSLADGLPDRRFITTADWEITSEDGFRRFTFVQDASGQVIGFSREIDGATRVAPRIGPLLATLTEPRDPDPSRTARADSALRALALGGEAVQASARIAAGAKAVFRGPQEVLSGYSTLRFLHEEDVAGRGIERHGGRVGRVVSFRLGGSSHGAFVLVHLTADGHLTDYDVVDQ